MIDHIAQSAGAAQARAMPSLLGRFRNQLDRLAKSEKGTASLDFVICVPVIMAIFMASIESGMLMTRFILLEQSVDIVMRNLRLGQYPNATVQALKHEICSRTIVMSDCESNITIDLQPVSTTTWAFPSQELACVDRGTSIQPSTTFNVGAAHQIMMVRVCVIQDAIFPTTGLGLKLPKDAQGGYGLIATSAFVNEP